MGWVKLGYLSPMAREADYYTAHETARVLGISPARVRQMLRAGELEGERGPEYVEGAPGPWRVPASAVRAFQEGQRSIGDAETVALPREEIAPAALPDESSPAGIKSETPSETSERLSEGVGALRDKAEEIIEELDRLEARLEAAEVEQLALRETASREKARAEQLQAELDAARSGRQPEQRGSWRRLFGR
jgi:Helix-turn-helix domain